MSIYKETYTGQKRAIFHFKENITKDEFILIRLNSPHRGVSNQSNECIIKNNKQATYECLYLSSKVYSVTCYLATFSIETSLQNNGGSCIY